MADTPIIYQVLIFPCPTKIVYILVSVWVTYSASTFFWQKTLLSAIVLSLCTKPCRQSSHTHCAVKINVLAIAKGIIVN